MLYRPLGQSGVEASAVAVGTWAIGGWMWGGTEEKESIDAIHAAIDAGINFIDTAPAYGLGLSEEIVGKAIADRRDRVVIATKCGLVWHTQQGEHYFNEKGEDVYKYLGPESIRHEVERSLARLGVETIDLYQTHWQDPTTPIADTMGELTKLKDEGKIRAIGVSNATPEHMDAYRAVGPVDSDQEKYSMLDREHENENLPYVREHNIAFLAYSPLALGLLTGKYKPGETSFSGDDQRAGNPRFSDENLENIRKMLEGMEPIAASRNLTIPQLVIAWTINRPGVSHALVGARNQKQAKENAEAGGVELTPREITDINDAIGAFEPMTS